jgi:hypothetical protein
MRARGSGPGMAGWKLTPSGQYLKRYERYEKKHPRELRAVLSNLSSFHALVDSGVPLPQVTFGWLHREPKGTKAITEKGGHGKGLKATRLYLYPDDVNREIHLITIGDKKTQKDDINFCKRFVDDLRRA